FRPGSRYDRRRTCAGAGDGFQSRVISGSFDTVCVVAGLHPNADDSGGGAYGSDRQRGIQSRPGSMHWLAGTRQAGGLCDPRLPRLPGHRVFRGNRIGRRGLRKGPPGADESMTERGWLADLVYADGAFRSGLAVFADNNGRITRVSPAPEKPADIVRLP